MNIEPTDYAQLVRDANALPLNWETIATTIYVNQADPNNMEGFTCLLYEGQYYSAEYAFLIMLYKMKKVKMVKVFCGGFTLKHAEPES